MKCPKCQAPTDVKQTKNGLRTRECFNNHTFKTQEIVITEPKQKRQWKKRDFD
jgi:ssDNA-binding Zn-finger/Zn-ribbon topoisomerase 1